MLPLFSSLYGASRLCSDVQRYDAACQIVWQAPRAQYKCQAQNKPHDVGHGHCALLENKQHDEGHGTDTLHW